MKIFQYWNGSALPAEVAPLVESWRKGAALAPSGRFRPELHDHEYAAALIRAEHGARHERAFRACAVPAMQADYFRYCALCAHGGLYVDADVRLLKGLNFLNRFGQRGLLFFRGERVANDLMAFRHPGDPLMQEVLEIATRNIQSRTGSNVWEITGPGIQTRLYRDHGPESPLFAGLMLARVGRLKRVVQFNWKLDYKRTAAHWTTWQERGHSLFVETPAPAPATASPGS